MIRSMRVLLVSLLAGFLVLSTADARAATNVVIDAGQPGGNGASNGVDDHARIVRNSGALDVYLNGTLSRSIDFASLGSLTVHGSDDDDTLTVDFAGGNPIPPGGLAYHGGANVTQTGDTLKLVNGTVVTTSYRFVNPTDGVIDVDGRMLTFTGLAPILDTVSSAFLFVNGTNGSNAITYRAGSVTGQGLVAVDAFETIEFANKTNLVINCGAGDDNVALNNPNTPTGLTTVTVNCGSGNDTISVYTSPVAVQLNGEGGDDLFRVVPSPTAIIDVNGGPHVLGDVLLVDSAAGGVTKTATSIEVAGFQPITYTDVERAERVGAKAARTPQAAPTLLSGARAGRRAAVTTPT